MIVGLSTFDTVYDRLSEEGADMAPSPRAAWSGIRGFNSGYAGTASVAQGQPSAEPFAAAYREFAMEAVAPPPEPEFDTTPFTRLSAAEIARDLGLLATDPPAALQRKRRHFASLNHPDRTPEEWREAATTRMKIANQLIDEALRKAAGPQALS